MKVAVIGDAMTDRYVEVAVERISPEAPVPVYRVLEQTDKPGGVANVYENVKGFFPDADLFSNPPEEIMKLRVVSGNHYLSRMDFEKPVLPDDYAWVKNYDAYIVSDYDKGFVTPELMSVLGDTGKKIYMGGKRNSYCGLELFVLNHEERRDLPYSDGINYLVVTHGEKPTILIRCGTFSGYFPVKPRQEVDVTGAGDVFFAHLACHMILGKPIHKAIPLANQAAGDSVEVFGTVAIPPCNVKGD